jgi:hypothetical protein
MASINLPCTADASSYSDVPTSVNGTGGSWNILGHSMGYYGIPFLKFNTEALVGLDITITKAELRFYYYGHQDYDPTFALKRALADWSETTLCWNNQPARSGVYSTHAALSGYGWKSIDVRQMLLEWLDGRIPNYGLALEYVSTGYRQNSYCYSKEYNGGQYAPYIYVEYTEGVDTIVNVARGKLKSSVSANTAPVTFRNVNLTNEVIDSNIYILIGASTDGLPVKMTLDLGHICTISGINIWHYFKDSRVYNNSILEVSADGTNWTVIFDSAVSGTYAETSAGKKYTFDPIQVRYVRDGINGSNINTSNHWVELQVIGTDNSPDTVEVIPCTADTWSNSNSVGSNYGLATSLLAMYSSYYYESWLKFDVEALKAKGIFYVNSAILKMYYYNGDIPDRIQVNEVHPVQAVWDELTLTHTNRPASGSALSTLESPSISNNGYGWRLADVTNMFNLWLTEAIPEHGVRVHNSGTEQLGSPGSGDWNAMQYYSKDIYSGYYAPFIEVQYEAQKTFLLKHALEYTGAVQTIELPAGTYFMRLYGGRGADGYDGATLKRSGGAGGYVEGCIKFDAPTTVHVHVGGGQIGGIKDGAAKYNGGGSGNYMNPYQGGCGGGASDIRIGAGTLTDRLLVAAGGGGGGGYYSNGGSGGGLTGGGSGTDQGNGGTQTSGGATGGAWGAGGNCSVSGGGGGGGGWYGGGMSRTLAYGGGGGSSYVGGTVLTQGINFPLIPVTRPTTLSGANNAGPGKVEIWAEEITDVFGRRLAQII